MIGLRDGLAILPEFPLKPCEDGLLIVEGGAPNPLNLCAAQAF